MMLIAFIHAVADWFRQHEWVVGLLMGLSLLTIVASFVLIPWAIVRIPPDYFAHQRRSQMPWEKLHPAMRILALALKNLLGLALLLAGIVMAIPMVPGPGVVTMLIGLALLDVPGKRRLERWIASQPPVFAALNKLRAKYGHPPLEKPGGKLI